MIPSKLFYVKEQEVNQRSEGFWHVLKSCVADAF